MQKKLYVIICLCGIILTMLCACKKTGYQEEPAPDAAVLRATVIEVTDSSLLVKPVDGSRELNSADKITIPNKEKLELKAGDLVEITYNGDVLETYPAQLGKVFDIVLVSEEVR